MILFRCAPDPKAAARGRGTTTTGRPNRATVARRGCRSPRSFRTRRSWAVDHAPVVVTIRFIAGQITATWSARRHRSDAAAVSGRFIGPQVVGPRAIAPTVMAPLALAAAAMGALAIGRLAIADAVVRRLRATASAIARRPIA